jgi:PAS domain S-box-containing protein
MDKPNPDPGRRFVSQSKLTVESGAERAPPSANPDARTRRYETLLNSVTDHACTFDLDHRLAYANPAMLGALGKPSELARGKTWRELGSPSREAAVLDSEIDRAIATKEPVRGETPAAGLFGRRVHEYIFAPILNPEGEVEAVAGTARDITDRTRAKAAERRSDVKYRTLFNSIDVGFCIIEVLFDANDMPFDYRFLEANPAFQKQTGIVDGVGRTIRDFAPDHEQYWFDIYGRIARTGVPERFEDAAEALGFYYDVYAFRIDAPAENHVAVLFKDISARRRTEKTLKSANQAKDEFLAMLGHELRNPLSPIVTALQLMRMREPDTLVREREIIDKQVGHLVKLVDDLLDVSRITRGKVELDRSPLELETVVSQALEMAVPLIRERGHRVRTDVGAGLVVSGDRRRLVQVVANLLTNAAKYSSPKGSIRVVGERVGDEVVLRVHDDGIGIEPELLSRVFELFTQGTQAIDRAKGGLGIGLALVQNLVTLHGGRVEARSEGPGRGSDFIVRLPAHTKAAAPADAAGRNAAAMVPRKTRRKVLVVDDYPDAANSLADVLEMQGYKTHVTYDGASALAAAADFKPEAALIDIGLPAMDGYEVARRLRATPRLESTTLIAVTGYGRANDRRSALRAGFDEHLAKPLDPDNVAELIEHFVDNRGGE